MSQSTDKKKNSKSKKAIEPAGKTYDLSVFWKSVKDEHPVPMKTRIRGEIPAWIEGSLYRNGPGLFEIGNDTYKHFFDGMALIHRYHIKNGQVTYQSKFLRSDNYHKNMSSNRIVCAEFGTIAHPDPCHNLFQKVAAYFTVPKGGDNCGVNMMYLGDELYAMTETQYMRKVDVKTLDTAKDDKVDMTKYVAVNMATAHPHYSNDGTHFNMGSSFSKVCKYNILKIEPPREGESDKQRWSVLCSIPARGRDPSYYHSFGMTDNYIVYLEQPLVVNVLKVLTAKIRGNALTNCMEYRPKNKAYFHVVNRHTGERLPTVYTADAFFCFHHINAYEDDGHIVVDMCCYNNEEIINRVYLEELKKGLPPADEAEGRRFVLPLNKGSKTKNLVTLSYTKCTAELAEDNTVFCTPEKIIEQAFEAPRINYERYNGKKYRYVYGILGNNQGLIKVDVVNKTFEVWEEKGFLPSEPVFIEAPSPTSEDDVVLSAVINSDPNTPNFLVVLNGKDFTEIGRAEIDTQIAYGIHGLFVPNV
ncbi:carotenoid-cleaving dioxygenase, mitochondrial-like isoform X2 [Ptychodera flava]|uniref:carotenoid-cleaving dioxygenase, mitochondrial-like isoform X2 n=1 Tax=Ptychodera flava TaxID=63121 RepID=UPI00396A0A03